MTLSLRPEKSPYWQYRFTLKGAPKPFQGSTGERVKRKAEQYEARLRAEVVAELLGQPIRKYSRRPPMTLAHAFERFWEEKAQFEKSAKTVEGQLNKMLDRMGEATPLHLIDSNTLTQYQTERRKDGVSDRTVSAEVPELLRRVFTRAKMWKVDLGDEEIDWRSLKLSRPQHRTRAGSRREMIVLLRKLRPDYRPIIRFALVTGLRRQALMVRQRQLDWDNMVMWYPKKSKHTGDMGWLPITEAMAKILKREMVHNGEWVFTYKRRWGGRAPITKEGLKTAMRHAVAAAGLKDWRLIHDLRHTAATNTLRKSQNLAAVQGMLGHSDISQTSRYAHVLIDDVRRAMG